ncbi:hypothetical protein [Roseomonas sp. 18066]|uniref:hypothetical protein n=1 Tax=Roseomonas sp. 18066 TaxID=2681412 RepID=UPI0013571EDD|nr:hypothetical protein [Roseomonas sp. 18066]
MTPLAQQISPVEDLRRCDATVIKLTKDYGKAKMALAQQPSCGVAAATFRTTGDMLMEAMAERHRREAAVATIRRLFRLTA